MPITARVAGATVSASAVRVLAGGVLRPVRSISVRAGGALRTAYLAGGAFTASGSPSFVSGYAQSARRTTVYSEPASIAVSGGQSPYTYTWSINNGRVRIGSPGMATSDFSADLLNETIDAAATCIACDATGRSVSVPVSIQLSHDTFQ